VAAPPPQAVRTIDAMINRDSTYKSFFMVRFLLYLGFGLERFENIGKGKYSRGSHLLYKIWSHA
jgi:hypothetical protein